MSAIDYYMHKVPKSTQFRIRRVNLTALAECLTIKKTKRMHIDPYLNALSVPFSKFPNAFLPQLRF